MEKLIFIKKVCIGCLVKNLNYFFISNIYNLLFFIDKFQFKKKVFRLLFLEYFSCSRGVRRRQISGFGRILIYNFNRNLCLLSVGYYLFYSSEEQLVVIEISNKDEMIFGGVMGQNMVVSFNYNLGSGLLNYNEFEIIFDYNISYSVKLVRSRSRQMMVENIEFSVSRLGILFSVKEDSVIVYEFELVVEWREGMKMIKGEDSENVKIDLFGLNICILFFKLRDLYRLSSLQDIVIKKKDVILENYKDIFQFFFIFKSK